MLNLLKILGLLVIQVEAKVEELVVVLEETTLSITAILVKETLGVLILEMTTINLEQQEGAQLPLMNKMTHLVMVMIHLA